MTRFEELLLKFQEESITDAEYAELLALLEEPENRRAWIRHSVMESALVQAVKRGEPSKSTRLAIVEAPLRRKTPAHQPLPRSRVRQSRRDESNFWIVAACAACALFVLGLVLTNSPSTPTLAKREPKTPAAPLNVPEPRRTDPEITGTRDRALDDYRVARERQRVLEARLQQLAAERLESERQMAAAQAALDAQVAEEKERNAKKLAEQRIAFERAAEQQRLAETEMAAARQAVRTSKDVVLEAAKKDRTQGRLASVEKNGSHIVLRGTQRLPAVANMELQDGDRILTAAPISTSTPPMTAVSITLFSGAEIELATASELELNGVERLKLTRGLLFAEVDLGNTAGKPEKPYTLLFETPHANVNVMGTRFDLSSNALEARVRMEEGAIVFSNAKGSQSVKGGMESAARASGVPEEPAHVAWNKIWRGKKAPLNDPTLEILLTARNATALGRDWKKLNDANTASGVALEALTTVNVPVLDGPFDYSTAAEFIFDARAGVEYSLWIRGIALPSGDPMKHDAVIVQIAGATFKEPGDRNPNFGKSGRADSAHLNGFMHTAGYWWIGGDADPYDNGQPWDRTPYTVRFEKTGTHTLKLFAREVPIRVDAIWISSSQKTRPAASAAGPEIPKK